MRMRGLAVVGCAAATLAAAPIAEANDWLGTALGAVVGGVIGNQFGSGSGNVAATALGAAIGSRVGTDLPRTMPSYSSRGSYQTYGAAHREHIRYEPAYYQSAPVSYGRYPAQAPVIADACAGELYYEGRYDPELARTYCQGRQEYLRQQRERELADARNRGLAGH